MPVTPNKVHRCIEDTAHGAMSLQRQDLILSAGVAVFAFLIVQQPAAGVVAGAVMLGVVLLGRRAWEGRRDYLPLLVRRLEKRRVFRALDPDTGARPYEVSE